ncbi:hypothetical protein RHE_CH02004 [Rhizobium etli CFN 42]|uniref:Transmembrane protein n=1 Tax=Rhizobium etli (strain ATCC 51251 / DSM 11541 / JCM 21823 / NBRC 15573 / CFN 42) TaxID=347834 RepID=Q2K8P7_RHIEC|nr:hypothetical protein [Rhizobium etli]ABC90789.1 hypothetical protein RHE_CH02004 [Rhizobium etli CFN 42]
MSVLEYFEGKGKWAFHPWSGLGLWVAAVVLLEIVCRLSGFAPALSSKLALAGAVMASLGVFTIARPVIRAGGYKSWLEKNRKIGGASYQPTPEELEEAGQIEKDALAVNIVGPALAIVGTIMNGASGFF